MNRLFAFAAIPFLAASGFSISLRGAEISADSSRGASVFELQGCVNCHALNGVGAAIGLDLGRVADRGFTPVSFAATIWNHAPAMWTEAQLRSVPRPALDEQQAADLFAFFYSLRFFEEPGDAGRGKALFSARKCAGCHAASPAKITNAKPMNQWTAPADPLELVETMWNHSTNMRDEMTRINIKLPQLSGQDLADLLVYFRSMQGLPRRAAVFHTATPEEGAGFFDSKGCAACHGPVTRFSIALQDQTLTDIAADMWNHGLDMNLPSPTFQPEQMRSLAGYIWSRRMTGNYGSGKAGANVFAAKKCTVCHDDPASGAPALTSKSASFSSATMLSALTRHGPLMLDRMREKHLAWPHFSTDEMSDLIAYLNVRSARNAR